MEAYDIFCIIVSETNPSEEHTFGSLANREKEAACSVVAVLLVAPDAGGGGGVR